MRGYPVGGCGERGWTNLIEDAKRCPLESLDDFLVEHWDTPALCSMPGCGGERCTLREDAGPSRAEGAPKEVELAYEIDF